MAGRTATPISRPASIRQWSWRPGQPFADDFLRPYQGFGRIQERRFVGYADYHALQMSVNRRRSSDGLSMGAAYTYQMSNKTLGAIDPFVEDNPARNYTSNGRRPHVLVLNYWYDVPDLSPAVEQPPDQGRLRQLAVLGRHDLYQRHVRRVHLQLRRTCRPECSTALARSTAARPLAHSGASSRAASSSHAIRTCREASAHSSGSSGPSASRHRPISSVSGPR